MSYVTIFHIIIGSKNEGEYCDNTNGTPTATSLASIGNCRKGLFCIENSFKEKLTFIGKCTSFGMHLSHRHYTCFDFIKKWNKQIK